MKNFDGNDGVEGNVYVFPDTNILLPAVLDVRKQRGNSRSKKAWKDRACNRLQKKLIKEIENEPENYVFLLPDLIRSQVRSVLKDASKKSPKKFDKWLRKRNNFYRFDLNDCEGLNYDRSTKWDQIRSEEYFEGIDDCYREVIKGIKVTDKKPRKRITDRLFVLSALVFVRKHKLETIIVSDDRKDIYHANMFAKYNNFSRNFKAELKKERAGDSSSVPEWNLRAYDSSGLRREMRGI